MKPSGWGLAWWLARRDLHRSVLGLRLLFVCLFLGTATLAAIGSLTASITQELAARGQAILGGDVEVSMTQREASAPEKAAFRGAGRVSETIGCRRSRGQSAALIWATAGTQVPPATPCSPS
jgi:putative ABC transport system permease protein